MLVTFSLGFVGYWILGGGWRNFMGNLGVLLWWRFICRDIKYGNMVIVNEIEEEIIVGYVWLFVTILNGDFGIHLDNCGNF